MSSVVVVGGGIVGTAVASACARGGANVTLVERGRLAGGASSLALALVPGEIDAARFLELHHFTGGAFFLDRSPPDEWPARRIGAVAAAAALAGEARSHGAEIRTGCDAKALLARSDAVRGVLTDAGDLRADAVVLACGTDARWLLAPHGILPELDRDAGELVTALPTGEPPDGPTVSEDAWVAADEAGLLHVARRDGATPLPALEEVAVLDRLEIAAAVGTPGPVDGLARVFLATPPDGWGIARSAALGASVAEWVTHG